ncbi:hypothetical protein PHYBLDRAFT_171044 [Phycomyces blakesleeanus NRRL 1555(-)]|uniref:Uncharacterized protein n=1 Tax=Phycomyces blakesleeanus (strain ATCC 8743b / DSM 1359 / FGSC 10004 / NBRC 33097 / NRRL 1555) TaxID=763407 RepID=A0A162WUN1_PHYB8|nr:hypothetical protein PHYBLDRAFT_171044 [Phycomyces blakesleeanus NRRL 1555(-)]OAD70985.1 hypothetical protein PHYBLDRAFT_171044 [Phycomyces blakesleeanus NRRL 1555(-)]|eukprot:XP_018289025.1 hypothetical protein PHYBLDRAFT_171044 [Phycomyces blakesleeanus NRRL 1555(-)]
MLDDSFVMKHSNQIEIYIIAKACRKFNNRSKNSIAAPMDFAKLLAASNKNNTKVKNNDYKYLHVCNLNRVYNSSVEHVTDHEHIVLTYMFTSCAHAVSLELFSMFFENNIFYKVYNKCVKTVNKYMIELGFNSILSYYKIDTLLKDEYPVKFVTYNMCINGCCRFSIIEEEDFINEDETCPYFGEGRYKVERVSVKSAQIFQMVSLLEQLRFKHAHHEEWAKMTYENF